MVAPRCRWRLPCVSLELEKPDLESIWISCMMQNVRGHWNFQTQRRNATEVHLKDLFFELLKKLVLADSSEWEAVLLSGIEVVPAQEVEALSRRDPDRVHSSCTVRRLKPQEVVGALAKAKSRWCVRGHQDPDTERLQVYARTPVRVTSHVFPSVVVSRTRVAKC